MADKIYYVRLLNGKYLREVGDDAYTTEVFAGDATCYRREIAEMLAKEWCGEVVTFVEASNATN